MTTNIYSTLDSALQDLSAKPPYGYILKSYRNRRDESRLYLELVTGGPFDNLDDLADEVERFLPKSYVITLKRDRIYFLCSNLPHKIRHSVTGWDNDKG